MEAVVLHAVGELKHESISAPALRPGTVRVEIGFCGVCGSDIPRCFSKGTYRSPTVCGHDSRAPSPLWRTIWATMPWATG